MAFTSRIGQSNSGLGNVHLGGSVTTLPAPVQETIPLGYTPRYFTGQLGNALSMPGNIVPGRPFMRLLSSKTLAATLTPAAVLVAIQNYIGVFRQSSVIVVRAVSRAFNFLTQPRNTAQ